jgi:hypothetical protein
VLQERRWSGWSGRTHLSSCAPQVVVRTAEFTLSSRFFSRCGIRDFLPNISRSVRRRVQQVLDSIAPDSLMHFLRGFPERLRGGADPNPTPKSKNAPNDPKRGFEDPRTLWKLVVDLGFSSQLRTFAPASSLFLQVGEHALLTQDPETGSASAGVSSRIQRLSRSQVN